MAEEREEKTLVGEGEVWAKRISQLLLFLAGSLTVPASFVGVSFGYPSRLTGSWRVKVG